MKLLLTGTAGQVGWELERALQPLGEVLAFDRSALDLADQDRVRQVVLEHRPDWVVNPAAYTQVDRAEDEPDLAHAVNVAGVDAIARACAEAGARLVHYSTDYVFDGTRTGAYTEDDSPNPLGVYGRTKLEGEHAVRRAGGRHVILRTSWVYAARGRNFLRTILRLAAERDELRVVDDQFGAPTSARFIADATAALIWRAESNESLAARIRAGETLHLTAAGVTSWHGFAEYAVAHADLPRRPRVIPIPTSAYPTRAQRPRNSALALERLRGTWGIEPPPWQRSVDLCLREIAGG